MPLNELSKTRLLKSGDDGSGGHDGPGRLVRMLRTIGEVLAADEQAIRRLPGTVRHVEAYHDIVSEGDKPHAVTVLVDDLSCRYKITPSGSRQILSFHVAGDVPDIQSLFLETMDHGVVTLEPAVIWQIPHAAMLDLLERAPRVARIFWRASLIEASIFREWMANLGQRKAYERIAHLLCEIVTRMQVVGLAEGQTCRLPISQAELADATGMSTVHVNRSLQELRRNKLIHWEAGALTILDRKRLEEAGEFNPAYLHLRTVGERR